MVRRATNCAPQTWRRVCLAMIMVSADSGTRRADSGRKFRGLTEVITEIMKQSLAPQLFVLILSFRNLNYLMGRVNEFLPGYIQLLVAEYVFWRLHRAFGSSLQTFQKRLLLLSFERFSYIRTCGLSVNIYHAKRRNNLGRQILNFCLFKFIIRVLWRSNQSYSIR